MGKLYEALSVLSIGTVLSVGAFGALLYFDGSLTGERVNMIGKVLRGEMDDAPANQLAGTDTPAAESQPASAPSGSSAEELRRRRREDLLLRASLERARRDLMAQKLLLDQALQALIEKQERFSTEKAAWTEQMKKLQDTARDSGFELELTYVSKLPPKQAKEHLLMTWRKSRADALRLLNALKPSVGQQILEQLKSPEEVKVLHELLEQLGSQEINTLAPESGTTGGATP